jgi:putative ABC transport system permease protein
LALSFVLLAAALLFARTLKNLTVQDLGMQIDGVTICYVDMSRLNLPLERRAVFKRAIMRQLEQAPGVISAAESSLIPLSGGASDNGVWVDGADATQRGVSFFMNTSAGYFKTMATPLLAGRGFDDDRDTPQSPLVAVVNEAFARKFFAGKSPVGKRFWREARADAPVTAYEIVGLVKDAKYRHLRQEFMPTAYLPISQDPRPGTFAQLLIRTSMPATAAVSSLRVVFRNASPEIVPTFQDFRSMIDGSLMRDRLVAALSGFFGLLAVLLATIGIYGLVSFGIAQRTREIGVRIALGAEQAAILKMIVREAIVLVCAGLLAGCVLVLALGRSVGALVYGLAPDDPVTLLAAALLLAAAALGASVVPARRAARLDPMAALRFE